MIDSKDFNPDQPRDEDGRFASGGAGHAPEKLREIGHEYNRLSREAEGLTRGEVSNPAAAQRRLKEIRDRLDKLTEGMSTSEMRAAGINKIDASDLSSIARRLAREGAPKSARSVPGAHALYK